MDDRYLTTADGHKLRYVTGGSGPPVLILHQLQVAASADNWSKHFETIGQVRTYYALDTLGWGFSDLLEEYSFDTWIEAIRELCDQLGLEQVDILGMSLGSWIGQLFAWRYPERVRRVAAIASPGVNPAMPGYAAAANATLPTRERLLQQGFSAEEADRGLAMMDRPGKLENWKKLFTYINDLDVREEWTLRTRLPEMQTPILFSNWDTNTAILPRYTFEMFSIAPNSRIAMTTGHPDDLVAPSLAFLQLDSFVNGAK